FNEGIAEYYSTFSVSGSDVYVGKPVPEHIAWLRNEPLIPLAQLFSIGQQSKEYHERSRQGVFYAESWALVHYLMRDTESREKLAQYLALVKNGRPIDEAFHVAFSSTFDAMELDLRSYIRRYSFTYTRYSVSDLQLLPAPPPQPMTRDEVLFELGDLLAHSSPNNLADAERFLTQATDLNGNHAGALSD